MQQIGLQTLIRVVLRSSVLLACAVIVGAAASSVALAQSGRRAAKPSTAPPISAPPAIDPAAKPPTAKPEPARLSLLLAHETSGVSFGWSYARIVLDECERRLRESPAISVQTAGQEINRKEAHDRAKAEKEAYVVLLQVQADTMDISRSSSNRDLTNAYINYIVFARGTAQTKVQGRVHLDSISSARVGGVRVGLPMPGARRIPVEHLLRLAARETADRLLAAWNMPLPSRPF